MNFDLRLPIGLMFSVFGAILTVFGFATNGKAELYERSLNININLWWGLIMLLFGLVMLGMALMAKKE